MFNFTAPIRDTPVYCQSLVATELAWESPLTMTPGALHLQIFDTDLEYLGDVRNYTGWCEDAHVVVADGGMERLNSLLYGYK